MQFFEGSWVALPTSFRGDTPDLEALGRLVELHVEAGTRGIVVAGSTGEAHTLTRDERRALIETAVARAAGRIGVMAGVGTADTRSTCELARDAQAAGAQALLVVTPYYCKPDERGLLRHFGEAADAVELPIALYNNPSRAGVDLTPALAYRIHQQHRNVTAIKDASGDAMRIAPLVGTGLTVLCGEDPLLGAFRRGGAQGSITVVGNLWPASVAKLWREPRELARVAQTELDPWIQLIFRAPNPVVLKLLMSEREWSSKQVRAPLYELAPEHAAELSELAASLTAPSADSQIGSYTPK